MKRLDGAAAVLCALAAAALAAAHAGNVADAAHDAGVARVLALDAQPWRALDVGVGALLSWLPVGTRSARAALGEALAVGAAAGALFAATRALLGACARTERLGSIVAAIAALSAMAATPWQIEGAVAGGAATGAMLVCVVVALLAAERVRWGAVVGVAALAVGQEPLVGACALGGCAAFLASERWGTKEITERREAGKVPGEGAHPTNPSRLPAFLFSRFRYAPFALAGLAPFLIALARTRAAGAPLLSALATDWAGERATSLGGSPLPFVRDELGVVLAALVLGGTVLAMLVARARPIAAALLAVVVLGFGSAWLGAPLGPTRVGAPVLAALAAASALSGVAMQAIVRAVAETRVPFARASAAMVLVLELVIPVDAADETLARVRWRAGAAAAAWDDLAWGALPPRAVAVVSDARIARRARAARAQGALRGDVTVVPALGTVLRAPAERALAADPALVPLWRDLALEGKPGEASLSSLAAARPLGMAYEPRWGRALGKHLVPLTLFDRFRAEPRGASDREKALDAFAPARQRLARAIKGDSELADATAYLLRARALDIAASGDRDLVGRAVEDLHAFAPDDRVAKEIVARTVLAKGPPKLDDLRP